MEFSSRNGVSRQFPGRKGIRDHESNSTAENEIDAVAFLQRIAAIEALPSGYSHSFPVFVEQAIHHNLRPMTVGFPLGCPNQRTR